MPVLRVPPPLPEFQAAEPAVPPLFHTPAESGLQRRAANLHLSTLPNFRLPGDTSSSSRYWDQDLINEPLEAVAGLQTVPQSGPGIGVSLNAEYVERITARKVEWRAG